ncbi:MAG: hypothetical protein ABI267_04290 [Ginsengibacter sp.]
MKKLIYLLSALFCFSVVQAQKSNSNQSAGISISLPLINNASFYKYSTNGEWENSNQTGYLGAGFAFFYKENQNKFSLEYENPSLNKSLFATKGGNPNINVNIFEATIHHNVLSDVALIGGLNCTAYRFHLYTDIPPFPKVDRMDATIGLTAGAEFLASESSSFVITYRPSIFSFDKKSYRAVFSFGIMYDVNFWKK